MAEIRNTKTFMRVVHRYLGYFMAGIMAIYALSGILLIYRDTDLLKRVETTQKTIRKNLDEKALAKAIQMRKLRVDKTENGVMHFNKTGTYNTQTGEVRFTTKELPYILDKMTSLHKASSGDRLSWLNILFGLSLFFYVLSSFWMFPPKSKVFRRGMVFAAFGFILAFTLLLL